MSQFGRPPKYSDPEELQKKIDEYFLTINDDNPPLIEELSQFLGFSSYKSFWEYGNKPDFSDITIAAKTRCGYELNKLALRNKVNAHIAGRNLSANYGINEKTEHEIAGKDGGPIQFETAAKKLNELFTSETDTE